MTKNIKSHIGINRIELPKASETEAGMHKYASINEMLVDYDHINIPGHQKFINIGKFLRQKAWESGIPLAGSFELTPLCNLDCTMCYVHLSNNQCSACDLITPLVWKGFIDQAIDAGMMFSQLTGGECLTYSGFEEIYLYLRSKGINTSILSNGTLIDNDKIDFFKENKPSYIQISLYGSNEDEYEQVTGRRYFHKVFNAINGLMKVEIPLRIAITVSKPMLFSIYNIIKLVSELNLPYSINYDLVPPYAQTGRAYQDICLSMDEIITARKLVRSALGKHSIAKEPLCMPIPQSIAGTCTTKKGMPCSAGRSAFAINWQGDLIPCNTIDSVKSSLIRSDFSSAWNAIVNWSMNHEALYDCPDCAYRTVCYRCPLMHELYSGEAGKVDRHYCNITRQCVLEGVIDAPTTEI